MKPTNIILEGVTGSRAYGLDTPQSDVDIKGIFVLSTAEVLGLSPIEETIDNKDPDWSYHEIAKFVKLALKGNPTILELLYLNGYRVLTKQGRMLIDNRHIFLSNAIRKSYGEYANSQIRKLYNKGMKGQPRPKHVRHCFRLLWQGRELLETGNITVRVTPAQRKQLFALGEMSVDELVPVFDAEHTIFSEVVSTLPDEPDYARANELLLRIRKSSWL